MCALSCSFCNENNVPPERNQGSELFNLLVYELNDSNQPVKVVFAKRGKLETDRENKRLLMHIYDPVGIPYRRAPGVWKDVGGKRIDCVEIKRH